MCERDKEGGREKEREKEKGGHCEIVSVRGAWEEDKDREREGNREREEHP